MPLFVNTNADLAGITTFQFVVPGRELWQLRSVFAEVTRAVGGTPDRSYALTVTDGTSPVARVGAPDAGDEPGLTSITWTDAAPSTTAAGGDGVVVAPLVRLDIDGGYVITGTIINPAPGDAFTLAVAWYDFDYTTP